MAAPGGMPNARRGGDVATSPTQCPHAARACVRRARACCRRGGGPSGHAGAGTHRDEWARVRLNLLTVGEPAAAAARTCLPPPDENRGPSTARVG